MESLNTPDWKKYQKKTLCNLIQFEVLRDDIIGISGPLTCIVFVWLYTI